MNCPLCKSDASKVIYAGLPARLCINDRCRCLFGGMSWLISQLPFNGVFMSYEKSYWRALWNWMKGDLEGEE